MNDAYDSYWISFVDAKIAEEYYFLYIHQSRIFLWGINVICMATSFTGVIALITSYLPNLASSIIILVPQLISLFQPFYPFGDRLYAAKLIYSEYSKLALDAEKNINQYLYGSKNIQDFDRLAVSFQKSLSSVEEKYAPPDLFPRKKRLHKESERNVTQYINTHFHVGG